MHREEKRQHINRTIVYEHRIMTAKTLVRSIISMLVWLAMATISMKITQNWYFKNSSDFSTAGSMRSMGLVGSEGEFYFHPQKRATLRAPPECLSKTLKVPILLHKNVLVPHGSDWFHAVEMDQRHLIYDTGDNGIVGVIFAAQNQPKPSLLGSLVEVKDRKMMPDGRMFLILHGLRRFYIQQFTDSKPYAKAQVQAFSDYSEDFETMKVLEKELFALTQLNVKMMTKLNPKKNYSMSQTILKYRPPTVQPDARAVLLNDKEGEIKRSSSFSFGVLDMLQASPATKLSLMQILLVEKRLERMLRITQIGCDHLKKDIVSKGLMNEIELQMLEESVRSGQLDEEMGLLPKWTAENFVEGKWTQKAILM